MRKKIVGIMLLTLSLIVFPTKANAELSCDRSVEYNITTVDQQCIQLNGLAYRMNLYTATLNGSPIKTYCIDPVLRNGSGVNRCVRRIDPSSNANGAYTQAYDVAVTKAYQILTEDGRNTTSTADRILGEVIFRWLGANYGQMTSASHPNAVATSGCGYRIVPSQLVSIFSNPFLTAYWNTGNPDFEYGKSVFSEAVAAGNMILSGSTYEQVVEATSLWNDEYNFNTTYETRDGVTYATVNMTLANDVQTVYWSQFRGGCSNNTVKCTTTEASGSGNTGKIVIQVTEAANYDGQPYGIYIDSAIYDIRSSSANMIIVQGSSRNQRMLLVADGSSNITSNPDFPSGGGRHHTDDNGNRNYCICDESTGYYVYTDENGNKTQWPEGSSRPSNVPSDVSCPGTCSANKHVCEIIDGQHYCNDGEPCSEQEYRVDCLDEVNCTSTISMPSDCVDLEGDERFDNDGYDATISDINQINTSCNPDTNQVKSCVLGKEDLTNQSFESTNYELGEDNPYCSIWCNETYNFNLPTAKYSTSGGYFTLSMSIKGQRDCYVSSADDPNQPINTQKFNEDLENARRAVIDAWNAYAPWKAASEKDSTPVELHCSYSGRSCDDEDDCDSCDSGSKTETGYTKEWSWVEYDYNGNPSNHSDSYGPGTTDDGTCDCSIDAEANRDSEHDSLAQDYKEQLIDKIEELSRIIRQYNDCTGAITNTEYMNFISGITSSTANSNSWNNKMNFDPVVKYDYYEDYLNNRDGQFVMDESTANLDQLDVEYFTGNIGETYGDSQDSNQGTNNLSSVTGTKSIFICNASGCNNVTINISNATWVRKTKTNEAEFKPNVYFSTYTQYGTIKVQDGPNNDYLWTNLPEGSFPVALIRETGVFPFKLTFYDVGQSNTNGSLGRLMNGKDSNTVLVQLSKVDDALKCNAPDIESTTVNAGYVCHYLNNCPGCDFICDDENNCEFEECEDGYCVMTCTDENDCHFIFDGANTTYNFRTVSLNNLFPNDRDIGYNWSKTSKAEATLNEISKGTDDSNPESIYETPQYSFTLTPTNLRNIREYNDEAGSFTNTTMPDAVNNETAATVCEKVTINGITYPVKCQSTFLDLIETSGNKYATNVIRPDPDDNNNWTLFSDTDYCPNGNCLGDGIGPAWK